MQPRFPLKDVVLRKVISTRKVILPIFADGFWQISQNEFAMQVEGVGQFYAFNGIEVEYAPDPGASLASLELYLNGSVYGAILHQRNILPLHGSSFVWQGKGIMLCGESGAGKSSITASFCLSDAIFLTDDVSPIAFPKLKPMICPLSDRIKLWEDSLTQLNKQVDGLTPGDTFPIYSDSRPQSREYLLYNRRPCFHG